MYIPKEHFQTVFSFFSNHVSCHIKIYLHIYQTVLFCYSFVYYITIQLVYPDLGVTFFLFYEEGIVCVFWHIHKFCVMKFGKVKLLAPLGLISLIKINIQKWYKFLFKRYQENLISSNSAKYLFCHFYDTIIRQMMQLASTVESSPYHNYM